MKTKLLTITVLTAVSIFFLSATTWADGRKRRHLNHSEHKHLRGVKHHNRHHQKIYWKTHHRHYHKKHYYGRHPSRRAKYQRRVLHKYKFHHHARRPVITHRHHRHYRPIYRQKDDNVSILASASRHGWKIRISSKN